MSWEFGTSGGRRLELISSAVPTAAGFTIGFWCLMKSAGSNRTLGMQSGSGASVDGWTLYFGISSGQLTANFNVDQGSSTTATTAANGALGRWNWVVAREVSAADHRVSLNGGAEATSGVSRVPTGVDRIVIGGNGATGDGIFVAEVCVWNTVLELSEAQAPWFGKVRPETIRRNSLGNPFQNADKRAHGAGVHGYLSYSLIVGNTLTENEILNTIDGSVKPASPRAGGARRRARWGVTMDCSLIGVPMLRRPRGGYNEDPIEGRSAGTGGGARGGGDFGRPTSAA